MPRKTRSSAPTSAPRRDTHTSARSAPAPVAAAPAPIIVQQPAMGGGGMLSQIASVAAGSAIGHVVGRTLTGAASSLFGGSESAPAENSAPTNQYSGNSTNNTSVACDSDSKAFLDCMSKNSNDVSACQFYLDMLKACQENKRFA